jgi:peptidoglycan/xylan/chitin deacetylase (PgdA/CDA1 family)
LPVTEAQCQGQELSRMPETCNKAAETRAQSGETGGAFVVSLDFELHWGVRDRVTAQSPYRSNLLGAREAIPEILSLFQEFEIAATWATVGLLFARSKSELAQYLPTAKPGYRNSRLDPYREVCGDDEGEDPLHYAPSLIALIQRTPKQEIGCHTFSHYYCLEMGQLRQDFEADISSAVSLARRRGIRLESIVFPRNQVNTDYLALLPEFGFTNYRGVEQGWAFDPEPSRRKAVVKRVARLADHYIPIYGNKLSTWDEMKGSHRLCNVRGSMFLRPFSPRLKVFDGIRFDRIAACIREAAVRGLVFHLWWHPHNFGRYMGENLQFLRSILAVVAECRAAHGLRSLSMSETAEANTRRSQTAIDFAETHRLV